MGGLPGPASCTQFSTLAAPGRVLRTRRVSAGCSIPAGPRGQTPSKCQAGPLGWSRKPSHGFPKKDSPRVWQPVPRGDRSWLYNLCQDFLICIFFFLRKGQTRTLNSTAVLLPSLPRKMFREGVAVRMGSSFNMRREVWVPWGHPAFASRQATGMSELHDLVCLSELWKVVCQKTKCMLCVIYDVVKIGGNREKNPPWFCHFWIISLLRERPSALCHCTC